MAVTRPTSRHITLLSHRLQVLGGRASPRARLPIRDVLESAGLLFSLQITANHLGFFEFKLCPNNNVKKPVTQACLDKYVLDLADADGTRFFIGSNTGTYHVKVKLPGDVTCSQCVLQWRYHTGNSYGVGHDGKGCIGCGPQEEFYGCADVAIGDGQPTEREKPSGVPPVPTRTPSLPGPVPTKTPSLPGPVPTKTPSLPGPVPTKTPSLPGPVPSKTPSLPGPVPTVSYPWLQQLTTKKLNWFQPITTKKPVWFQPITTEKPKWWQPITTKKPAVYQPMKTQEPSRLPVGFQPLQGGASGSRKGCWAINLWADDAQLDWWCTVNCARNFCPPTMCACA